jgi:hypothetical protein
MRPNTTVIDSIPGKLECVWLSDANAILDTWTTYEVALEDFRRVVLIGAVAQISSKGAVGYIVDSSSAEGAFSDEIQNLIGAEIFPAFAKAGIKYFITITSKVSYTAKRTVADYAAKTGPNGLKLVEVDSVDDAIGWLKANA